ncbi:hypothetical protein [Reinekea marinisedimentorum]|uniref:Uncharacterized protein n=1 Tax=Reinekea marinisedimentorum TaxID=230495 RepID=A0A4R3I4R9_9GAMM|nr:hypothetical protein [Reinekea marinisedimentorum]TCS40085.1 hypothetical protein BCF53_1101 [Reinekea marinisedimentorum]
MSKVVQLRGQNLLDAIEKALIDLSDSDQKYVYNASELARKIGCSRPTLNSKKEFIDSVLEKIGAAKRLKREHPLLEQLHMKIEKLEAEKKALEEDLNALRQNHADIFTRLYRHSSEMSALIRPIAENDSIAAGKCILCSQSIDEGIDFKNRSTVFSISRNDNVKD